MDLAIFVTVRRAAIHQALHGYDRGHRLLAASVELSSAAAKELLEMSDLSGSRDVDGFEEYITGYPLADTGYYVLARTWQAYEMPRPGCVWTHSLLIPRAELRWPTGYLSSRHRRPALNEWEGYRSALTVTRSNERGTAPAHTAAPLIEGLYGTEGSIWVAAETSRQVEDEVLAIWDQQWPALRFRFSFSTGSLRPRFRGSRLIDLQVTPTQDASLWSRVNNATHVLDRSSVARWAEIGADDVERPDGFGTFLADVALTATRAVYPLLAITYDSTHSINDAVGLKDVLGTLQSSLLSPAEVKRASAQLVSPKHGIPNAVVLQYLAETPNAAFERRAGVSGRIRSLVAKEREAAWQLARFRPAAPVGKGVIDQLASAVAPFDLLERPDEDWPVVIELVRRRPALASAPEIWLTSLSAQESLIAAVAASAHAGDLGAVVQAIVASGSHSAVDAAAIRWPERTVPTLLDHYQKGTSSFSPYDLGDLIHKHPAPVVTWLRKTRNPRHQVLSLLADHLPIDAAMQTNPRHWVVIGESIDSVTSDRTIALLFVIGLKSESESGVQLLMSTFEPLHRLAAANALSDRAWRIVDAAVPHLGILRDWDRCERIRRGLIRYLKGSSRSPNDALSFASLPDTRRALARSIDSSSW